MGQRLDREQKYGKTFMSERFRRMKVWETFKGVNHEVGGMQIKE